MTRGVGDRGRAGIAVAALASLGLLLPSAAAADSHLIKVTEVYAGTGMAGTDDYVELQMLQAGQNLVSGREISVYDASGAKAYGFTFPSGVPNAQAQRTILLGAGPLANGVDPDFEDAALAPALSKNGGAACFDAVPVDCVAWGDITPAGLALLPGAAGSPVAPTGIPNGSSITRGIAAGCATLLEAGDDTDDSAADFEVTTDRTPRPNTGIPTERSCGGGGGGGPRTTIDKGPKKRTPKTKARFRFSSPDEGAEFECSLDGARFKGCRSPLRLKRLKPGRHELEVRAVVDGAVDGSPAGYRWKVVRR